MSTLYFMMDLGRPFKPAADFVADLYHNLLIKVERSLQRRGSNVRLTISSEPHPQIVLRNETSEEIMEQHKLENLHLYNIAQAVTNTSMIVLSTDASSITTDSPQFSMFTVDYKKQPEDIRVIASFNEQFTSTEKLSSRTTSMTSYASNATHERLDSSNSQNHVNAGMSLLSIALIFCLGIASGCFVSTKGKILQKIVQSVVDIFTRLFQHKHAEAGQQAPVMAAVDHAFANSTMLMAWIMDEVSKNTASSQSMDLKVSSVDTLGPTEPKTSKSSNTTSPDVADAGHDIITTPTSNTQEADTSSLHDEPNIIHETSIAVAPVTQELDTSYLYDDPDGGHKASTAVALTTQGPDPPSLNDVYPLVHQTQSMVKCQQPKAIEQTLSAHDMTAIAKVICSSLEMVREEDESLNMQDLLKRISRSFDSMQQKFGRVDGHHLNPDSILAMLKTIRDNVDTCMGDSNKLEVSQSQHLDVMMRRWANEVRDTPENEDQDSFRNVLIAAVRVAVDSNLADHVSNQLRSLDNKLDWIYDTAAQIQSKVVQLPGETIAGIEESLESGKGRVIMADLLTKQTEHLPDLITTKIEESFANGEAKEFMTQIVTDVTKEMLIPVTNTIKDIPAQAVSELEKSLATGVAGQLVGETVLASQAAFGNQLYMAISDQIAHMARAIQSMVAAQAATDARVQKMCKEFKSMKERRDTPRQSKAVVSLPVTQASFGDPTASKSDGGQASTIQAAGDLNDPGKALIISKESRQCVHTEGPESITGVRQSSGTVEEAVSASPPNTSLQRSSSEHPTMMPIQPVAAPETSAGQKHHDTEAKAPSTALAPVTNGVFVPSSPRWRSASPESEAMHATSESAASKDDAPAIGLVAEDIDEATIDNERCSIATEISLEGMMGNLSISGDDKEPSKTLVQEVHGQELVTVPACSDVPSAAACSSDTRQQAATNSDVGLEIVAAGPKHVETANFSPPAPVASNESSRARSDGNESSPNSLQQQLAQPSSPAPVVSNGSFGARSEGHESSPNSLQQPLASTSPEAPLSSNSGSAAQSQAPQSFPTPTLEATVAVSSSTVDAQHVSAKLNAGLAALDLEAVDELASNARIDVNMSENVDSPCSNRRAGADFDDALEQIDRENRDILMNDSNAINEAQSNVHIRDHSMDDDMINPLSQVAGESINRQIYAQFQTPMPSLNPFFETSHETRNDIQDHTMDDDMHDSPSEDTEDFDGYRTHQQLQTLIPIPGIGHDTGRETNGSMQAYNTDENMAEPSAQYSGAFHHAEALIDVQTNTQAPNSIPGLTMTSKIGSDVTMNNAMMPPPPVYGEISRDGAPSYVSGLMARVLATPAGQAASTALNTGIAPFPTHASPPQFQFSDTQPSPDIGASPFTFGANPTDHLLDPEFSEFFPASSTQPSKAAISHTSAPNLLERQTQPRSGSNRGTQRPGTHNARRPARSGGSNPPTRSVALNPPGRAVSSNPPAQSVGSNLPSRPVGSNLSARYMAPKPPDVLAQFDTAAYQADMEAARNQGDQEPMSDMQRNSRFQSAYDDFFKEVRSDDITAGIALQVKDGTWEIMLVHPPGFRRETFRRKVAMLGIPTYPLGVPTIPEDQAIMYKSPDLADLDFDHLTWIFEDKRNKSRFGQLGISKRFLNGDFIAYEVEEADSDAASDPEDFESDQDEQPIEPQVDEDEESEAEGLRDPMRWPIRPRERASEF